MHGCAFGEPCGHRLRRLHLLHKDRHNCYPYSRYLMGSNKTNGDTFVIKHHKHHTSNNVHVNEVYTQATWQCGDQQVEK